MKGKKGAPEGNKNREKFKEQSERKALCDKLCSHLRQGLSQEAFPECDWDTVERYIKEYPEDFPAKRIDKARREGRLFWELLGMKGTLGMDSITVGERSVKLKSFNAISWIFTMANRYGWKRTDRHIVSGDEDGVPIRYRFVPPSEIKNKKEKK